MFRNLWFQLHWFIGITAGLILAFVGATGALLSFEADLLKLLNPGILRIESQGAARLSPNLLLEKIQQQVPDKKLNSLTRSTADDEPARIQFAPEGKARRGEMRYVNPYTGQLLENPQGREFFRIVTQLHRNLMIPNWGKQITGICAICLVFLCLSGLYLRWPRQWRSLKTWFTFSFKRTGRGFLWDMHSVLGTWALLMYLLAALTGLYWSYDWYRNFLRELAGEPVQTQQPAGPRPPAEGPNPAANTERPARDGQTTGPEAAGPSERPARLQRDAKATTEGGSERPARDSQADADSDSTANSESTKRPTRRAAPPTQALDVDQLWAQFEQALKGQAYRNATLRIPQKAGTSVEFTYLDEPAAHERATNRLQLEADGSIKSHQRYDDKPLAKKLIGSMLPLHMGTYFGLPGQILMFLASLGMPIFAITGWMLYLDRRRKKRAKLAAKKSAMPNDSASSNGQAMLVYASQSGTAEGLAWQSAEHLQRAGWKVQVKALSQLNLSEVDNDTPLFIINATFGDGEAPDNARAFSKTLKQSLDLSQLNYACLSLGDSDYANYCGFGRQIDGWLQQQGAKPLFNPIEADKAHPEAINHWFQQLASLTGQTIAAWQQPEFVEVTLTDRQLLNPGSQGLPCFHIGLQAVKKDSLNWQAGDILEVQIPTAEGHISRDYSIASIPQDGQIELLIRQTRYPDGRLGLGSGWLSEQLALQQTTGVRIRRNSSFHTPAADKPLILIGNGTGLAGLRSHLHARRLQGAGANWLIFGERNRQYDFYYQQELQGYLQQGQLQRLDLVFSRDQAERRYVQHELLAQAELVRDWLSRGAVIMLCGSLQGMGAEIEQALAQILGTAALQQLQDEQRLLRDLY